MKTDPATAARDPARIAADGAKIERSFSGLGVAQGIAIGPAHKIETGVLNVPDYAIEEAQLGAELARLDAAVAAARQEIIALQQRTGGLPEEAASQIWLLLEAHLQMLTESRLVRDARARLQRDLRNAESAMRAAGEAMAGAFDALGDPYLAARGRDVREVADRVLRALVQAHRGDPDQTPLGGIVVAEEVSPADTALMDPARVAGFVATLGGPEGHTAIMARSLGIPAVMGIAGVLDAVASGDIVVVDGQAGRVVVNPTEDTLAAYRSRQEHLRQRQQQLARLKTLPAVTRDGTRIRLHANMDLTAEVAAARASGAEGVGLLRTEFLFMNRGDLPSEDEQYALLAEIVRGMAGTPVTVRTLDVGGEKVVPALQPHLGEGANPALGLRAIRLSLRVPELLDAQLRAILRASVLAAPEAPLRILLPMVTSPQEMVSVRAALRHAAESLSAAGVTLPNPLPALGAMIEVPGAALSADALAQEADFFAIGTNDLTMYTLAIDRADERVASLYNPLHPAVLRLIQFAIEAALRARIPVSVCGEMAGDPRYTALLIGLGVTELSMAPPSIPQVKQRVRSFDLGAATRRAMAIMDQADSVRIRTLLEDFNALP